MSKHGPRVRVEAKRLPPNATRQEREKSAQQLLRVFKRACNEYGVMHMYKEHEFYIRPGDKKRRAKAARKNLQIEKNEEFSY